MTVPLAMWDPPREEARTMVISDDGASDPLAERNIPASIGDRLRALLSECETIHRTPCAWNATFSRMAASGAYHT